MSNNLSYGEHFLFICEIIQYPIAQLCILSIMIYFATAILLGKNTPLSNNTKQSGPSEFTFENTLRCQCVCYSFQLPSSRMHLPISMYYGDHILDVIPVQIPRKMEATWVHGCLVLFLFSSTTLLLLFFQYTEINKNSSDVLPNMFWKAYALQL